MTMPKTAAVMKSFHEGILPTEMTDEQLALAMSALSDDLPGDPLAYISRVAPNSKLCECGALHLAVDAPDLKPDTRASLHRLLATPYGDLVRENMRRQEGYATIRFGWDGIEAMAPSFTRAVEHYGVRQSVASAIDHGVLTQIIDAFRKDMPKVMEMVECSAASVSVCSVSPQPGNAGHQEWKTLIDQVMFAWSTPVRKYLAEWLSREFGLYGGAVNCCIIMTGHVGNEDQWRRRWMEVQTSQQLTPDC